MLILLLRSIVDFLGQRTYKIDDNDKKRRYMLGKSRKDRERALRYVTSFGPMNLLYNLLERMTSHGGVRVLSYFEIFLH